MHSSKLWALGSLSLGHSPHSNQQGKFYKLRDAPWIFRLHPLLYTSPFNTPVGVKHLNSEVLLFQHAASSSNQLFQHLTNHNVPQVDLLNLSYVLSSQPTIATAKTNPQTEKTTWWGCGLHVPMVFETIPETEWCVCAPKVEKEGKEYPPKGIAAN